MRSQLFGPVDQGKKRWKDEDAHKGIVLRNQKYAELFEAAAGSKSGEDRQPSKRVSDSMEQMRRYEGAAGYRNPESTHASPRKPSREHLAATHVGEIIQGNPLASAQVPEDTAYKQRFQGAAGSRAQPVWRYNQELPPSEIRPSLTPRRERQQDLFEVIQQHPQDGQAQLQQKLQRLQLQDLQYQQRFEGAHGVRPPEAMSSRSAQEENQNMRHDVGGPSSVNVGLSIDPVDRSKARLQLEAKLYEGRAGARSDPPSHQGIRVASVANASELDELLTGRDVDDSARRIASHMRAADFAGAAGTKSKDAGLEKRIRRVDAPKLQSQVDELIWGHDIDGSGGHGANAAIDGQFKVGKKMFPSLAAHATHIGESLTWDDELVHRPGHELSQLPPVEKQPKSKQNQDVIDKLMADMELTMRS